MTLIVQFEKVELLSLPLESMVDSVETMGTTCSGTLVTGDRFTVSQTGDNYESVYVYDETGEDSTEISRDTTTLDSTGVSSSLILSGLYSDTSGIKTIQDVIHMEPERSVLTSIDETSVSSVTIDGSISWDKNDCCLYMASDKIFRFKYNPGTETQSPRLSLEALNQAGTSYVPKFEIEKN